VFNISTVCSRILRPPGKSAVLHEVHHLLVERHAGHGLLLCVELRDQGLLESWPGPLRPGHRNRPASGSRKDTRKTARSLLQESDRFILETAMVRAGRTGQPGPDRSRNQEPPPCSRHPAPVGTRLEPVPEGCSGVHLVDEVLVKSFRLSMYFWTSCVAARRSR